MPRGTSRRSIRPSFISFEGIEGAGKGTQIRLLADRIGQELGFAVVVTREPGDGPIGAQIRNLVLYHATQDVDPRTELLLMLADRAQHVERQILPALEGRSIVLCDRYVDSSVAYQGYGRDLDRSFIDAANRFATAGLMPIVTVLIDLDPEIGLARQMHRNKMEEQEMSFHRRVREGYLEIARSAPKRFRVVEGSRTPEEVHEEIWSHVRAILAP